mgnify:CR=1 FL=1
MVLLIVGLTQPPNPEWSSTPGAEISIGLLRPFRGGLWAPPPRRPIFPFVDLCKFLGCPSCHLYLNLCVHMIFSQRKLVFASGKSSAANDENHLQKKRQLRIYFPPLPFWLKSVLFWTSFVSSFSPPSSPWARVARSGGEDPTDPSVLSPLFCSGVFGSIGRKRMRSNHHS